MANASITVTDSEGNQFEFSSLDDHQLLELMNVSRMAEYLHIPKSTLATRCCRMYPGSYRSLVTALQMPNRNGE